MPQTIFFLLQVVEGKNRERCMHQGAVSYAFKIDGDVSETTKKQTYSDLHGDENKIF